MTLKPCPFCDARGRKLEMCDDGDDDGALYWIVCTNCSAEGPRIRPGVDTDGNFSRKEAREAWNTTR